MIELMLTIDPPPVLAICSAASLVPRKTLVWLTAMIRCQPSRPSGVANGTAGDAGIGGQDVGDDYPGTLGREEPGLGFAHAVSATGNDRNLVFQAHGLSPD